MKRIRHGFLSSAWPAGLVSDEGGVLSHAAVLVREFGLPGVVGVVERPNASEMVR